MRARLQQHLGRLGQCLALALGLGLLALPGNGELTLAHAADGHPARVHEGTCEALGPVAFPLTGVGAAVDLDQQPIATPTTVNPQSSYQIMESETIVPMTLQDLLTSDHAVMIYDNDVDMQGVACGTVGGALLGDTLAVGLAEMGVPGHTGFALFRADGDQMDVTVLIGHAMAPVSASGGSAGSAMSGMGGMGGTATPMP
jgi:hypothetical protein